MTRSGRLYVASGTELYKLSGHQFQAVARAAQEIQSAVAAANGTIYLGEASALQAVSPGGSVRTIEHADVSGLGLDTHGAVLVVTDKAVERLTGEVLVPVVHAAQFRGLRDVPDGGLDFGGVAADGEGDLYLSASGAGFSLYELTRTGRARFVSPFRGADGKPAPLTIGPDGVVYGEWQNAIYVAHGGGVSLFQRFPNTAVRDYQGAFLPAFIAASGQGGAPLYADADSGNGYSMQSAILAIYPEHRIVLLWKAS